MRNVWLVMAAALVLACSSDEDATSGPGGGASGGQGGGGSSSASSGGGTTSNGGSGGSGGQTTSAGGGGSGGSGGAACDFNGFTPAQHRALGGGQTQATLYRGRTAETPPFDDLSIQLWHDFGADTGPHQFTFTGENFRDCHTCAFVAQGCADDLFPNCEKIFLVQEGVLDITDNATNFTGSLTNARAIEVTVAWPPGDYTSTPVPNGETWCIPNYTFDVTVTAP